MTTHNKVDVESTIREALEIGPLEVIRRGERNKGYELIDASCAPSWFIRADWNDDIVMSRYGRRVRIVLLTAKVQGRGSFRRLVINIIRAGLIPNVLSPMPLMQVILVKWNWRKAIIGSGHTQEEYWFPQRKFIDDALREIEQLLT